MINTHSPKEARVGGRGEKEKQVLARESSQLPITLKLHLPYSENNFNGEISRPVSEGFIH